jgi:hypothetical protein
MSLTCCDAETIEIRLAVVTPIGRTSTTSSTKHKSRFPNSKFGQRGGSLTFTPQLKTLPRCLLIILVLLASPLWAQDDCEAIYRSKLAELNGRLTQSKRDIENDHQKSVQEIETKQTRLRQLYEQALKEQFSPNEAAEKECDALQQSIDATDRSIGELTRSLNSDMGDAEWDPIMARIKALQEKREKIYQEWKACKKRLLASRKPLGDRQAATRANFLRLTEANSRIRTLEAVKTEKLADLERARERELAWLQKQKEHCRKTGQWVAQETGPLDKTCACKIKTALEMLAGILRQQRAVETSIQDLEFEIGYFYSTGIDEFASRVESAKASSESVVFLNTMSVAFAIAGKALDEVEKLNTEHFSEFSGLMKIGKEVLTNADAIVDLYKNLTQEQKDAVEKTSPAFAQFLKARDLYLPALKKRNALKKRERKAWKLLEQAALCMPGCKLRTPQKLIDELRGNVGPTEAGRKIFLAGFDGPNSPYRRGLLASDLNCDLCAALQALLEMQAYRDHAQGMEAQLRLIIIQNKKALRDINAGLAKFLERSGALDARWYKITSTVGSLFGPVGVGVAVGDAGVDLFEHYYRRLPLQEDQQKLLKQIGSYLSDNELHLVYWKHYAQRADEQMADILNRLLSHCLSKPCDKKVAYSPSTLEQSGLAKLEVQGQGIATGTVFVEELDYTTADRIAVSDDMVYVPDNSDEQRMLITAAKPSQAKEKSADVVRELEGYCLDPYVGPPKVAGYVSTRPLILVPEREPCESLGLIRSPSLERLKTIEIPKTGLSEATERATITQWYIWNTFAHFDRADGLKKIEEQVKENNLPATPDDVKQLNDRIWDAVDLTRKAMRAEAKNP